MLNCSSVLSRNGFVNGTLGLTKDICRQKNVFTNNCVQYFKTIEFKNTNQSKGKIDKYYFNQNGKIILKDILNRNIHSSIIANNSVDINNINQSKRSNNNQKSNIDIENLVNKLFKEDESIIESELNSNESNQHQHHPPHHHHHHHHRNQHQHHSLKKNYINTKDLDKVYPNAKLKLNNIFQHVNHDLKKKCIIYEYKKGNVHGSWTCNLKINWPEELTFTCSNVSNKNKAASGAASKCLFWLEENKKIVNGLPVIYDKQQIYNLLNKPIELIVKSSTLDDVTTFIEKYDNGIKQLLESQLEINDFRPVGFQDGAIIDPVGNSNPKNRLPEQLIRRNEILLSRYEKRMVKNSYLNLPILDFKDKIIKEIENNQVMVIKGDTGCGKTTQVPQYIMDYFSSKGKSTECNIIVSQPRRISAISLAERIAEERKEQIGDVIGYQVRLTQQLPDTPGGILFCTSGILLRKLQFNPTLEGCSHVIIDEAHERSINIDMLLVLLKRAMNNNKNLKVIIMSATINANLFQNYFNCNVLEIPGRLFPVEMNFMDDIDKLGLRSPSKWNMSFINTDKYESGPLIDIVKIGELIGWITRNQPDGAILCFLPGWPEISKMKKYLEEYSSLKPSNIMIVPVHSKISNFDQKKIFKKPPPNVRKIVLATDIAETGITVADVVYVIDCCVHRQVIWNNQRGLTSIVNQWISQANINQRKGRAGRVKPGKSYHFVTKEHFNTLPSYPIPEIKRSSLEKTVLDCKTFSIEKAKDFLGCMPEPPYPVVIDQAVNDLIKLGALDNNENLTPLGKRISMFTLHPKLSKAIVYSSIFQCLMPILNISSLMSADSELFTGILQNKTAIRNIKSNYHKTSDHIGLSWLFEKWNIIYNNKNDKSLSREFCFKNFLYPERMLTLSKIRYLNAEHLYYANMISQLNSFNNFKAKENSYSELDELIRGVLLSGVDHVLYQRDFEIRNGNIKRGRITFTMEDGHRATITPESVNFKRQNWPSPFLTYIRKTHSEERRISLIRETSIISPLTVFLFIQDKITGHLHNQKDSPDDDDNKVMFTVSNRKNINFICDKQVADVILNFRNIMWKIVKYMVTNYGLVTQKNADAYEQIEAYKQEMLIILAKLLSEAAEKIDKHELQALKSRNKNNHHFNNNYNDDEDEDEDEGEEDEDEDEKEYFNADDDVDKYDDYYRKK